MQTQIKTWGNSQGVRLSKELLNEADMNINDILDIKIMNGMIVLAKVFRHRTLEERAAEYGGNLYLCGESEWKDSVAGNEVW